MKKSVRAFVAAWLVLVLLLSGLPMAALASGANAYIHEDTCECSGVQITAIIGNNCGNGNHMFGLAPNYIYENRTMQHYVTEYFVCGRCGAIQYGESYFEFHRYSKAEVVEDDGDIVYRYYCVCGDKYYDTK